MASRGGSSLSAPGGPLRLPRDGQRAQPATHPIGVIQQQRDFQQRQFAQGLLGRAQWIRILLRQQALRLLAAKCQNGLVPGTRHLEVALQAALQPDLACRIPEFEEFPQLAGLQQQVQAHGGKHGVAGGHHGRQAVGQLQPPVGLLGSFEVGQQSDAHPLLEQIAGLLVRIRLQQAFQLLLHPGGRAVLAAAPGHQAQVAQEDAESPVPAEGGMRSSRASMAARASKTAGSPGAGEGD